MLKKYIETLLLLCILQLQQQTALSAKVIAGDAHGGAANPTVPAAGAENKSLSINITNYQVKTTSAAELPKLLLKEATVRAAKKEIQLGLDENAKPAHAGNGTTLTTLKRKTTPTADEYLKNITKVTMPDLQAVLANQSKVVDLSVAGKTNEGNKTLRQNVLAAEGVTINIPNSTTLKQNNTENLNARQNITINGNKTVSQDYKHISKGINSSSTTTTTTSTTSTTTTTTTTTTPKPKKPSIVYGTEDFPDLDGNIPAQLTPILTESKLPTPETAYVREPPLAEPSQEQSSSFPYRKNRDYIVPIVAIMFAVPFTIGIVITAYRHMRDFWSTRHYRRMDFLVDGMYND